MRLPTLPAPPLILCVVVLDVGGSYTTQLTAAQADGLSCVRCGASEVPKVPVGRCYLPGSVVGFGGVQAFRCSGLCEVTR